VVDCAEVTTPEALIVENVPDFLRWKLYPLWKQALELLGYQVTEHRLVASRFGAPQRRDRLFVVGTRDGRPVELAPSATETPFGPCIDWDAPAKWRRVSESTPSVRGRVAKARGLGPPRRGPR
jgi:DNA (cytosine-5)-methyltransferase 1